jgi:O-antigen ligase
MQSTGNDFVTWNNPYNSVISTTGNPNFSSAIYAILCIYTVSLTILSINKLRSLEILFNFSLSILLFISILNTGSLQGVLAFAIGLIGFILIISFRYKKVFGVAISLFFTVLLTFGILGMLQMGPLQNYLYKDSVSVRGFYWRAAIEMFRNNPLLGVGLDNYAQFFNLYRTSDYPLRYGFEVTSSNAHNTFFQHFATGGLLFGLSYLILQICVLFYAVKMLTRSETKYWRFILPVFCGWLTFQAQSLVSIDNIAISVLGWLSSAIIIGLGSGSELGKQALSSSSRASGEAKQVITSYVMAILVFIFCTFLFRVESAAIYIRSIYNPSNSDNNKLVLENGQKFFTLPFNNINYQNQVGVYLASSGYPNQAVDLLNKSLDKTPNSLDSLNVLANIYESANQPSFAIPYRVKIAELNPWNAKNYLQQGKNYRDIGDFIKMEEMLLKIRSFASSNEVYNIAVTELKKPS